MALRIRLSELTEPQRRWIRSMLTFRPTSPFTRQRVSAPPSLIFYRVVEEEGEPVIYLPYRFGSALRQCIPNDREYPRMTGAFTGTLRDDQVPWVQEGWTALNQHGAVLLSVYTGGGKTAGSLYCACRLGLPTLVILPITVVLPSWVGEVRDLTSATCWVVDSKRQPPSPPDIIICMVGRIKRIPAAWLERIGTLIVDETHKMCSKDRAPALLHVCPRYIIGLSATPEREDGMHQIIEAMIGKEVITVRSPKPLTISVFFTGITIPTKKTEKDTIDWEQLQDDLAHYDPLNQLIVELVRANHNHKIIIMVWTVDHVERLITILTAADIPVASLYGRQKTYLNAPVLIGTIGKIGTGMDEKNACTDFDGIRSDLLILAASTKCHALLEQMIGRVRRGQIGHVIDLVHNIPLLVSHWKKRQKWYRLNATSIVEARA